MSNMDGNATSLLSKNDNRLSTNGSRQGFSGNNPIDLLVIEQKSNAKQMVAPHTRIQRSKHQKPVPVSGYFRKLLCKVRVQLQWRRANVFSFGS